MSEDIFNDTGFSMKNVKKSLQKGILEELEEKFKTYFYGLQLNHKALVALALMDTLDKLWNEPLKDPSDVDKIIEHWRYQLNKYLKEDEKKDETTKPGN